MAHFATTCVAFLQPLPLSSPRPSSRRTSICPVRVLAVAKPPTPPQPPTPNKPPRVESSPIRIQFQTPPSTTTAPPDIQPTPDTSSDTSALSYLFPRFLLLIVAAVWGTNFATVKYIQSGVTPVSIPTAALARFSLAAVALLPGIPYELSRLRRLSFPPGFLLAASAIGLPLSIGYFTQSVSLSSTDASTSAFICSLGVVVVPIINRITRLFGIKTHRERSTSLATWGAPLLAVLGVALLEFGGSPPTSGDAWALCQAVGFAGALILNERVSERYPGLILSQTALQLVAVSILSLLWAIGDASTAAHALVYPHIHDAFLDPTNATALFYTGLITTAMTIWVENIALVNVTSGEVAVLLSTEPFWAAWFSSVVLNEHMGPQAVLGGAIILVACLVNQSGKFDLKSLASFASARNWLNRR